MKSKFLFWCAALVVVLNLLSCGGGGGEGEGSSTGPLDSKFGKSGKVTTTIGTFAQARALIIQPDNKLVAAGFSNTGSRTEFALARYNTDGSLDTTFNPLGTVPGIVTTSIFGIDDEAFALVIQPADGKLVAAGYSDDGSRRRFALVRYNTDGSLDSSFGPVNDGTVTTNISGVDDEAFALVIQPSDNSLVAAGYSFTGSQRVFAVVRYDMDANNVPEIFDTPSIGSRDQAFALGIQQNGKLVAAGSSKIGSSNQFAVARYNDDGTLDSSFGTGGIITTAVGGSDDSIQSLVILPDGRLVVSGYSDNGIQYVFALVRYHTDGTIDPTFGFGGIVTTGAAPLGKSDFAFALALQPNGKLVTAGRSNNGNQTVFVNKFAVARYNPTGSLDTTFTSKGIAVTSIDNFDDQSFAVLVQPGDDKLVAAGTSFNKTTNAYQFALIRYTPKP